MNKKQWEEYNAKIFANGKKHASKKDVKKFLKRHHIKLVKPTESANAKFHWNAVVSRKNVQELEQKMLNALIKVLHTKDVILDLDVKLSKDDSSTKGSVALEVFNTRVHVNVYRKVKSNGYTYGCWYPNIFVFDPNIAPNAVKKNASYVSFSEIYSWIPTYTSGYLKGLLDKFLQVPAAQRQFNGTGHHYISKD